MKNTDCGEGQREQWFIERIGNRIRRSETNCCEECTRVHNEGLVIHDLLHARYLADISGDCEIAYYDTQIEMLNDKPHENNLTTTVQDRLLLSNPPQYQCRWCDTVYTEADRPTKCPCWSDNQ